MDSARPKYIVITLNGTWRSVYDALQSRIEQTRSTSHDYFLFDVDVGGASASRNSFLAFGSKHGSPVDCGALQAYEEISSCYKLGDKIIIYSFLQAGYLVLKELVRLLMDVKKYSALLGKPGSLSCNGAVIPIHSVGVVGDSPGGGARMVDDMLVDMPYIVQHMFNFELTRERGAPVAWIVGRNPEDGAVVSRESWTFGRETQVSLPLVVDWLLVQTKGLVQRAGYFGRSPTWSRVIDGFNISDHREPLVTPALQPCGLQSYALYMYDHEAVNSAREKIHLRYVVWVGRR
ncbi:hypothetical protein FRC08_017750 [Ceratobasidium sp. 394]|nr:hypothetical protein FRC08_017750 [Ceratobasidium sp. 394]KAG9091842.1 hypothetical protein FS749_016193 [Ceratobasidium sp. UAMH 11750]